MFLPEGLPPSTGGKSLFCLMYKRKEKLLSETPAGLPFLNHTCITYHGVRTLATTQHTLDTFDRLATAMLDYSHGLDTASRKGTKVVLSAIGIEDHIIWDLSSTLSSTTAQRIEVLGGSAGSKDRSYADNRCWWMPRNAGHVASYRQNVRKTFLRMANRAQVTLMLFAVSVSINEQSKHLTLNLGYSLHRAADTVRLGSLYARRQYRYRDRPSS